MATDVIEIGTISARGQIAIPSEFRKELKLKEGSKMLFFMTDDAIVMKKITAETFSDITKPFRNAKKKIKEADVTALMHKMRNENNS